MFLGAFYFFGLVLDTTEVPFMSKDNNASTPSYEDAVAFYREHSTVKSNGIREVPRADFVSRLEEVHGVTKDTITKVQDAINFETTAAAHLALADLEEKISAAPADQLKDDAFRRDLSSVVRLPTFGGNTEVTVYAEKTDNIPGRIGATDADGNPLPTTTTTYGRTRTSINTKARIDKAFHDTATARIKAALGVS